MTEKDYHLLTSLIAELNKKLSAFNQILSNNNTLYEVLKQPSPQGRIGGEELSCKNDKTTFTHFLPFCLCGKKLNEDEILICTSCKSTLCQECPLEWEGYKYCRNCYEDMLSLPKEFFLTLLAISYGLINKKKIAKLSKICEVEDVAYILSRLIAWGLVKKEGFLIKKEVITATGLIELDKHYRYFHADADVISFELEVKNALEQRLDQ